MEKKIFIANIVCVIAIIILGYLTLFTTSIKLPETVDIKKAEESQNVIETETNYAPAQHIDNSKDEYPDLGKLAIVRTLFTPVPTPTPRPPEPTPTPSIQRIIQDWKLQALFGKEFVIENMKTQEEIRAKQGDVIDITYRNDIVQVKIVEVNSDENYVIFEAFGVPKVVTLF